MKIVYCSLNTDTITYQNDTPFYIQDCPFSCPHVTMVFKYHFSVANISTIYFGEDIIATCDNIYKMKILDLRYCSWQRLSCT